MTVALRALVAAVTACLCTAQPLRAEYYRPQVSGSPAGQVEGTILDYGAGLASGSLVLRDRAGALYHFMLARDVRADGTRIVCALPPHGSFHPSPAECRRWPAYIRLGITRVRVPFWRGVRRGRPVLIAAGFTTLPPRRYRKPKALSSTRFARIPSNSP